MTKDELQEIVAQPGYPIFIENKTKERFKVLELIEQHNAKSKTTVALCVYTANGQRFTRTPALFANDTYLANSQV